MRRVIVSGPPCSGKSTYVRQHAKPGDLILDRDEIAASLGSSGWDHSPDVVDAAEREMHAAIGNLPPDRDVWIIRTLPDAAERATFAQEVGAEVVLLDVSAGEAKRRAEHEGRPAWTSSAIDRWWATHTQTTQSQNVRPGTPEPGAAMTDTKPSPADVDAKATGGSNDPQPPEAPPANDAEKAEETRLPDDHPLVTAFARQKAENESLKEKARRLDELEDEKKTETEKLTDRLTKAEDDVKQIPAKVSESLRAHLVQLHEISDEDAELFLTATDPEVLLKQADRLVARGKSQQQSGHVPTQGTASPSGAQVSSYELGRERGAARYQKNN